MNYQSVRILLRRFAKSLHSLKKSGARIEDRLELAAVSQAVARWHSSYNEFNGEQRLSTIWPLLIDQSGS